MIWTKFLLVLLFLQSCSNVKFIETNKGTAAKTSQQKEVSTDEKLSSGFVEKVKIAKQLKNEGKFKEAKAELNSLISASLNSEEMAVWNNLMGAISFAEAQYEESSKYFKDALSKISESNPLQALIRLNLASSSYKLERYPQAFQDLSLVKVDDLAVPDKAKYYQLSYRLHKVQGNVLESLKGLIGYFAQYESVVEIQNDSLLDELNKQFLSLPRAQKWELLYLYEKSHAAIIPYIVKQEIENLNNSHDVESAEKFKNWLNEKFSKEQISDIHGPGAPISFNSSYQLNLRKLGIVMPMSGLKSKYAERAISSIKLGIEHFHSIDPSVVIELSVQESRGGGGDAVRQLVEKEGVGVVIGGLFPEEAKSEYLEAKKYGVVFLSLSPVYLPKEEKTPQLIELSPSVQSVLKEFFTEKNLNNLGRRGAIFYSDDVAGKNYFSEFWNYAQKNGVEVKAIQSFDRQEKDLTIFVKRFLEIEFIKEREEEKRFMDQVYLSGFSNIKRIQTLPPYQNYDWIFLPILPEDVQRVIPSFFYFELSKMNYIGLPTWRSKSVQKLSERTPLYFFDNNALVESSIKNVFWNKKQFMPGIIEYNSFLAVSLMYSKIIKDNAPSTSRSEFLNWFVNQKELTVENESWSLNENLWVKKIRTFRFYQGTAKEF